MLVLYMLINMYFILVKIIKENFIVSKIRDILLEVMINIFLIIVSIEFKKV